MTPEADVANVQDTPVDPPSSSDPSLSAAPSVVPVAPPPASDAAQAGAEVPPVDAPPGDDPGAAALADLVNPDLIESVPLAGVLPTSEPIDTPAKALAVLGEDSGVPAGTVDIVVPVSVDVPAAAHPADVIDTLRAKLYAYGEECFNAVKTEVEYLIRLHPRL